MNSLDLISLPINVLVLAYTNQSLLIREKNLNYPLFSCNSGFCLWYCLDVFTNVPQLPPFPNTFALFMPLLEMASFHFSTGLSPTLTLIPSTLYKPARWPAYSTSQLLPPLISQGPKGLCFSIVIQTYTTSCYLFHGQAPVWCAQLDYEQLEGMNRFFMVSVINHVLMTYLQILLVVNLFLKERGVMYIRPFFTLPVC